DVRQVFAVGFVHRLLRFLECPADADRRASGVFARSSRIATAAARARSDGLSDLHVDSEQLGAPLAGAGRHSVQLVGPVENQLTHAETILLGPTFHTVDHDKGTAGTL